jgi:hypothetical protein
MIVGKERQADNTKETSMNPTELKSDQEGLDTDNNRKNNVNKREETASNNGEKRGNNGRPKPSIDQIVQKASENYRRPPKEHQFKPGNPGGPGAPKGPRSMRKLIRQSLFEDLEGTIANAVTVALFKQALKGNTHALRLVVEQGNNRRGPKGTRRAPQHRQSSQ